MDIRVLGSNMEIGAALTEYVEEHVNRHVKKYFENAVNADIHFTKQNDIFKVVIVVNDGVSKNADIKSESESDEAYGCFNDAMEKAAKQLRRYKRKIKNHRREKQGLKSVEEA